MSTIKLKEDVAEITHIFNTTPVKSNERASSIAMVHLIGTLGVEIHKQLEEIAVALKDIQRDLESR